MCRSPIFGGSRLIREAEVTRNPSTNDPFSWGPENSLGAPLSSSTIAAAGAPSRDRTRLPIISPGDCWTTQPALLGITSTTTQPHATEDRPSDCEHRLLPMEPPAAANRNKNSSCGQGLAAHENAMCGLRTIPRSSQCSIHHGTRVSSRATSGLFGRTIDLGIIMPCSFREPCGPIAPSEWPAGRGEDHTGGSWSRGCKPDSRQERRQYASHPLFSMDKPVHQSLLPAHIRVLVVRSRSNRTLGVQKFCRASFLRMEFQ